MVLRLLYDLTQSWNGALVPQWEKVRLVLLKRCFYRSRGLLPLGNVSVKEEDVNGFFSRTKKTLSSLHGCHMGFAASPPLLHTRTGSGRVCRSYKHREWYHAVCVMRVARGQSKVVRFCMAQKARFGSKFRSTYGRTTLVHNQRPFPTWRHSQHR